MTQWGLDTLFNPAKRHMDEEKRRLQSTREQIGDASGGKRIDLESGKVVIRRGGPKDAETAADVVGEADDTKADDARGDGHHAEATTDDNTVRDTVVEDVVEGGSTTTAAAADG